MLEGDRGKRHAAPVIEIGEPGEQFRRQLVQRALEALVAGMRHKQLVAPFRKSVVSSRGYYVVRSTRAAGKKDVADFEAWLLEETKKDAAVKR